MTRAVATRKSAPKTQGETVNNDDILKAEYRARAHGICQPPL